MRGLSLAAIAVTLLGAIASATAAPGAAAPAPAPPRAAILSLELAGDAAPALVRSVGRGVADGLAAAGLEVVSLDDTHARITTRPDLIDCGSPACVREIGALLAVGQLLRARVEARGADYQIELTLIDVADGSAARQVTETCTVCTIGDLSRRASEAARRLASGTPRGDLVASQADATGARSRTRTVLPWALAGGGVAALATGVALVVADGRGTCDDTGECERVYATGPAGWLSLVAGAGMAGAAGYLFYREF